MINTAAKLEESLVADDVLAARASAGSAESFARLVARHEDAVYAITSNLCGPAEVAEEAIQEAFLDAWRDVRSFPAGSRFRTWLYRIAVRVALMHPARAGRDRSSRVLDAFLPAFDVDGALIASDARWPELEGKASQRADIVAPLRDALECMDDQSRAAFVLCDLVDVRVEEAAVILDLPPRTVRSLAHRARVVLRGFIDRLSPGTGGVRTLRRPG